MRQPNESRPMPTCNDTADLTHLTEPAYLIIGSPQPIRSGDTTCTLDLGEGIHRSLPIAEAEAAHWLRTPRTQHIARTHLHHLGHHNNFLTRHEYNGTLTRILPTRRSIQFTQPDLWLQLTAIPITGPYPGITALVHHTGRTYALLPTALLPVFTQPHGTTLDDAIRAAHHATGLPTNTLTRNTLQALPQLLAGDYLIATNRA